MANDKIKKTAHKFALQNAIQFNGKADKNAVTGKVIATLNEALREGRIWTFL